MCAFLCYACLTRAIFFQNLLKYALKNVSFQSWKHMKYNSNIQFADGFLVKLFNMYEYHLHIRWRNTPNQLQPVFWIRFFALDHILNASFSEHNFISSTLAGFCIRYFRWHSAQSNPVRSISAMLLFYAQHSDDRRQNHINEFYGNFIIFRR